MSILQSTHPSPSALSALREDVEVFGFGVLTDALSKEILEALQAEAHDFSSKALVAEQTDSELNYRARIHGVGPIAEALLQSEWATSLLAAAFPGKRWTLTQDRSSFTFYAEGDHLDMHLDDPEGRCEVTAIIYLEAQRGPVSDVRTGLVLQVFGTTPQADPVMVIPTVAGAAVFGRGSCTWHGRPRLSDGEYVAALTACYEPA